MVPALAVASSDAHSSYVAERLSHIGTKLLADLRSKHALSVQNESDLNEAIPLLVQQLNIFARSILEDRFDGHESKALLKKELDGNAPCRQVLCLSDANGRFCQSFWMRF